MDGMILSSRINHHEVVVVNTRLDPWTRQTLSRRMPLAADVWLRQFPLLIEMPFGMQRTLLKSKIHRATVTDAQLHYEGSVTIDTDLMRAADIIEHEQVHIFDVNNGNRLITYAIPGPAGSGVICINGAAAHLVSPGDMIIICCFAQYEEGELGGHHPRVVHVDGRNRQTK